MPLESCCCTPGILLKQHVFYNTQILKITEWMRECGMGYSNIGLWKISLVIFKDY